MHKPTGMTSHDVVSVVRRALGVRRVGHAGTLDPGASGVLPVAVGKATRLIEYMMDTDKEYEATLELGYETDSGDLDGEVIGRSDEPLPSRQALLQACELFRGEILQVPPMHSAIKIQGKKLCDLARRGITVERPARPVVIHKLELLAYEGRQVRLRIGCSKGTYIRVLCGDLGRSLGCLAVMTGLVRTRVGFFSLGDSVTLDEIRSQRGNLLQEMQVAIRHLPALVLDEEGGRAFCLGQKRLLDEPPAGGEAPVLRIQGPRAAAALGIGRIEKLEAGWCLVPVKVLQPAGAADTDEEGPVHANDT